MTATHYNASHGKDFLFPILYRRRRGHLKEGFTGDTGTGPQGDG